MAWCNGMLHIPGEWYDTQWYGTQWYAMPVEQQHAHGGQHTELCGLEAAMWYVSSNMTHAQQDVAHRPAMRAAELWGSQPSYAHVERHNEQPSYAAYSQDSQRAESLQKPSYIVVWNVAPSTTTITLAEELFEIDFIPRDFIQLDRCDGAFLLEYGVEEDANIACIALDDTSDHVRMVQFGGARHDEIPAAILASAHAYISHAAAFLSEPR